MSRCSATEPLPSHFAVYRLLNDHRSLNRLHHKKQNTQKNRLVWLVGRFSSPARAYTEHMLGQ